MVLRVKASGIWLFLFAFYCLFCFQVTELKFYNIKLNELITLILLPFLLIGARYINRYLLYFLVFFLVIVLLSFLKNLNQDFYLDKAELSLLKWPYFISLSRFLEFLACFTFAVIVCKATNYFIAKGYSKRSVINAVLTLNVYFSVFLIFAFLLFYSGILSYKNSDLVYDTAPYLPSPELRLRAFYVEGGPLGLLYAFLFGLSSLINQKKYYQKGIFVLVILLAQSKAGIIAVVGWFFYKLYVRFRHKPLTKYVIFLILLPAFLLISVKVAENYLESYKQTEVILEYRADDTNFTMGRSAAFYIGPKMFIHNPLLGVGLGNYSLVRNDPRYLGIMPVVNGWDLPGLGGILTLLIENGLIGFGLFLLVLFVLYKKYARVSVISGWFVILFLLVCCLGVQLYFLYIWFLIGMAVSETDPEEVYEYP